MEGIMFGTYTWNELVNWYLALPAYGQILCLLAAFALISFTIAIVYYVIKGTVYLLYYVFKGVIYLIAAIFYGMYWIFESIYCGITGNERPSKDWTFFKRKETQNEIKEEVIVQPPEIMKSKQEWDVEFSFCHDCGSKFTESMIQHLKTDGIAFCPHCGKGYMAKA